MSRKLSDLFVRGMPLTVSDDASEGETVYLQKLNPAEQGTAIKKANAARATYTSKFRDSTSEEYLASLDAFNTFSREDLIDYIVASEIAEKQLIFEAEIAAEEEWSKDDYLEGLREAWKDSLEEEYFEEEKSPESLRVYAELEKFTLQLSKRVKGETDYLRTECESRSDDAMRHQVTEKAAEMQGGYIWLEEYRKQEIFLGTRNQFNHKERYFERRAEIDDLAQEVYNILLDAFNELNVESLEGKDSPPIQSSSPQSESLEEQGQADSSGQAA